jgi:integrator complex subunit 11
MSIRVVPLGAGQDVGRSCVIVSIGRKNIMFDCGMHMGYNDDRRFPDFKFISRNGQFTQNIYAVIISHLYVYTYSLYCSLSYSNHSLVI